MYLKNGSKIAIIGGGPAGSFFAHFALLHAKRKGIKVDVTIFEEKDFTKKGSPGCNMSAGVLSEGLLEKLSDQNIKLPTACIQQIIEGYYLQAPEYGTSLYYPYQSHKTRIITTFRGNGPRFTDTYTGKSFDSFLLENAKKAGASVILQPVTKILPPKNPQEPIKLIYERNGQDIHYKADLLVGAFGVNSHTHDKSVPKTLRYLPPKTIQTCMMDICPTKEVNRALYGNNIYVFSLGTRHIRFASIIPKGEFLTICLVGKENIQKAHLNSFLNHPKIQDMIPEAWNNPEKRCICFPKIPVNHAIRPYDHRFVVVGDAGISRTYKNGIDSAFITAQIAAKSAFERGIAKQDFREGYFEPAKKLLGRDNVYGSIILTANDIISRQKHIVSIHIKYMAEHPDTWTTKQMNKVLWNSVTGNAPYKDIFYTSIHPRLLLNLLPVTLRSLINRKTN